MPNTLWTSCLSMGAGMSLMALSLFGSVPRPSDNTMWPKEMTSFYLSCILLAFSFMHCFCLQWVSTSLRLRSWSLKASSFVSPDPKTKISSAMAFCPRSPSSTMPIPHWNSSGAVDNPNSILSQQYLPQSVPKVVAWLLNSSNWMCQNPFLACNTVKTRAFDSRGRTSSVVGRG